MADIGDELRRALWHARIPGKSTEDKVAWLLEYFEITQDIADALNQANDINVEDEMMNNDNDMEEGESVPVPNKMLEKENGGGWVQALPDELLDEDDLDRFYLEHQCKGCGSYSYIPIVYSRNGTEYPEPEKNCPPCPECGGILEPIGKQDYGL